jgi:hypothetical protein
MSGYISAILRAIETTKNDPAQLRSLVYELARISLGKQILLRYDEIDSAKLHQHLSELENAIKKVESLSDDDEESLEYRPDAHLIEGPTGHTMAVVRESADGTTGDAGREDNNTLVVRQAPGDFHYEAYPLPAFLKSSQIWEPAQTIERLPARVWSNVRRALPLLIVAVMSVALYAGFVERSDYATGFHPKGLEDVAQSSSSAPKTANGQTSRAEISDSSVRLDSTSRGKVADFELPTDYGVYALSGGKLFQLDSLPIRVPDPRVAISAMISKPSPMTIPPGRIAFVVYRRDLVSSAPDKVLIRVVARVVREMKFTGTGPATTIKIDDQWAVRSNSYEFRVAPLDDNPEMIVIRAASSDFSLPAGRYALVLKEQAFDFNIDGQVTDAAQCLERTDAVGGAVYSECRKIP